jgi:uncharacterized protein with gpF-like domain
MKLEEKWYLPIEEKLSKYFYEVYFKPLIELFNEPLYNSKNDVINALRQGKITMQDGKISGTFNIKMSKELSKFATFNRHEKVWKIKNRSLVPSDVLSAAVTANQKASALGDRLKGKLREIAAKSKDRLKAVSFNIDKASREMDKVLGEERYKLGIEYIPNEAIRQRLVEQYNKNMKLSIVNENKPTDCWDTVQVERLRDMISQSAYDGYNRQKMIEAIQSEFETSKSKARFLARQETSLFMSTLRDERYIDAGIEIYQWLGSNDIREVGNPAGLYPKGNIGHGNHWALNRKYCRFDNDDVYADSLDDVKNNKWKLRSQIGAPSTKPGIQFLCRCVAKGIII